MASSIASSPHSKPCSLCAKPRDVLIRCQIDATGKWHLVCPGTCWRDVSGGVVDGDQLEEHRYYRYGGVWKNKHDAVSGKKPKKPKQSRQPKDGDQAKPYPRAGSPNCAQWNGNETKYTKNDRILFEHVRYICRKSHVSEERKSPAVAYSLWKEDDANLVRAESPSNGIP